MSRKLDLEFVQTPFFSLSGLSWLNLLMLMLSLVTTAFIWQTYQTKQVLYVELELKLDQLNQQQKKIPVTQVPISIPPEKIKQIEQIVSALATPWSSLFLAIEQSDHKDIALLGLEPNSQKQQVVLTGEAKNLQVVLDYIQQLEQQPALAHVYLQKHSIDEADISKPVRFTVFAKWEVAK